MKHLVTFLFSLTFIFHASAQQVNPRWLNNKWEAQWIFSPESVPAGPDVWHFRKTISLDSKPGSFIVHITAVNRYKLYVNGKFVGLGPARSDPKNWNFQTLDIAPYLTQGKNVVAAVVWNFGANAPMAEMPGRTLFLLQGNTIQEQMVNTDQSWKVMVNKAYQYAWPDLQTFHVVGPGENIDFNKFPEGWKASILMIVSG